MMPGKMSDSDMMSEKIMKSGHDAGEPETKEGIKYKCDAGEPETKRIESGHDAVEIETKRRD